MTEKNSNLQSLQALTRQIVNTGNVAFSMRSEIVQLAELLAGLGHELVAPNQDISTGETRTLHGLAVSPKMAAMCADDYMRTVQFIRGTHAAILDVLNRYPTRPARILYAGCGPYATLAVPLMSIFSAEQVRFTLIDIHDSSIASVKAILKKLKLTDRVADIEIMDASTYQTDSDSTPDIILLELMKSCLDDEPQVAITRHLLAQAKDAILVPEEIRIDLVLVNPAVEFNLNNLESTENLNQDRIPVGTVFTLNRNSVARWEDSGNARLTGERIRLPEFSPQRYQAMLFTTITVYQDHILSHYESGLTCPKKFQSDFSFGAGDSIQFSYELGQNPTLKAELAHDMQD